MKRSTGLSDLQKKILEAAYANGGGLTNQEALTRIYGLEPIRTCTPGISRVTNKRRSCAVIVVKSFARLVKRGLAINRHCAGIALSEEGTKVARGLNG